MKTLGVLLLMATCVALAAAGFAQSIQLKRLEETQHHLKVAVEMFNIFGEPHPYPKCEDVEVLIEKEIHGCPGGFRTAPPQEQQE